MGPNKYPLYKVYMGLIIKGTIPRVPAFSLWFIYVFNILKTQGDSKCSMILRELLEMKLEEKTKIVLFQLVKWRETVHFFANLGKCIADSKKWIWWNDYI